ALEMIPHPAPFDVTGDPAMSVPCALVVGVPIGLMLVGRRGDDATLLRAADAYEREVFRVPPPGP
ncbi:MAG: amidase, partial [Acidimicrobiales bacterium]